MSANPGGFIGPTTISAQDFETIIAAIGRREGFLLENLSLPSTDTPLPTDTSQALAHLTAARIFWGSKFRLV
jgi:hypothetical protein